MKKVRRDRPFIVPQTLWIVEQLPGKNRRLRNVARVDPDESGVFAWKADRDCLIVGVRTQNGFSPVGPRSLLKGDTYINTLVAT